MSRNDQKKIAVINDFCGFGRCSITVSLPIISAMKIQCCPLPTSIFSNHTGYDSFFFTDCTDRMDAYIDEWVKLGLRFDGILTGFLGSPGQIGIVKRFFDIFKTDKNITVIDPVMGDHGRLYSTYSPVLAKEMSSLLPCADILTPNLTEACILAGTEYDPAMSEAKLRAICEKICSKGVKKIVLSGIERGDELENFVYESDKGANIIRERKIGPSRAGTGDVFSSIIAADAVNGVDFTDSVRHAAAFISKAIARTVDLDLPDEDGICFEEFLGEI